MGGFQALMLLPAQAPSAGPLGATVVQTVGDNDQLCIWCIMHLLPQALPCQRGEQSVLRACFWRAGLAPRR